MSKQNTFSKEKASRLTLKTDMSLKGSIDEPIIDLITTLNTCHVFYTTSSCSGRVSVLADNTTNNTKGCAKWLFISHDLIQFEALMTALTREDKPSFGSLKLEPFVLHVCCDGLSVAKQLLRTALDCGFRNSGMTISKRDRIIVAVRSSQSLEIPVICDQRLIVSEEYIKYIVEISNQKLKQNFDKIKTFYSSVKSLCENINNSLSIE